MAVNCFVLQVQLPGNDPSAERRQNPPRQITIEKGSQQPQSVYAESERDRRPFDATLKRRKLYDLHELRPETDARRITSSK
jgi:hypothetical protein